MDVDHEFNDNENGEPKAVIVEDFEDEDEDTPTDIQRTDRDEQFDNLRL